MKSITFSDFRNQLKYYLDQVADDHSQLLIKRTRGEDVIVMSKEDYETIMETFYLISNTNNAVHLAKSLEQIKESLIKKVSLNDLKNLSKK